MTDLSSFLVFYGASLLLIITPGPDMLYVATRGTAQGRSAGLVSALAIGTGCLVHISAAALGLSAFLMYSSAAYTLVKYAGAAYIIYLGIRMLLSTRRLEPGPAPRPASFGRIFKQGIMVNVLNPKVALFFLSFLPQFAQAGSPNFAWQIIFLGLVFVITSTLLYCLVALGADRFSGWLSAGRKTVWQPRISGAIFIGMGVGLCLTGDKSR